MASRSLRFVISIYLSLQSHSFLHLSGSEFFRDLSQSIYPEPKIFCLVKIFTDGFCHKSQAGVRPCLEARVFIPRGQSVVSSLVTSIRCAERLSESDPTLLYRLQTRKQRAGINGQSLGGNNKFSYTLVSSSYPASLLMYTLFSSFNLSGTCLST